MGHHVVDSFSVLGRLHEKYYHHAVATLIFYTLIFSLLDKKIFLKLYTLFCMHVSLKSFTKWKSCLAGPEQGYSLVTPLVQLLQAARAISVMCCLIEDADGAIKQWLFITHALEVKSCSKRCGIYKPVEASSWAQESWHDARMANGVPACSSF